LDNGKNDRICSFSVNNLPIVRSNPKKFRTFAAESIINQMTYMKKRLTMIAVAALIVATATPGGLMTNTN
jgi:hypothetical protein